MYKDYRVEAFIPAGRKRTMSILLDNLSRFQSVVDRVQIWFNTDESQKEDNAWLESLPDIYGDWVKLVKLTPEQYNIKPKQLRTGLFYSENTIDEDTIYIRFDDDIVFIDDAFFRNLLDFRLEHPEYFLVMANILNNAITSYIYQQLGMVGTTHGTVEEPFCMEPTAWRSGPFATELHTTLVNHIATNTTDELFFDHADLENASRFSISCFCFFGRDFAKFDGVIGQRRKGTVYRDEEIFLTEIYPTLHDKLNTICGTALVAHYSFFAQRPYLDKTDVLDRYAAIAKGKLSDSYYELLDTDQPEKKAGRKIYETVELPPVHQVSAYTAAVLAEKLGYRAVEEFDRVLIMYKDVVVKTMLGKMLTDQDIDRALAAAYAGNH